jgi:hypothetical protein
MFKPLLESSIPLKMINADSDCRVMGQASSGTGYFNLWLKSLKNANGSSRYT